jgi:NAD(P)-dependent dehydrogenase (short-subunit alcohol dehydrogenase family)
MRTVLITGASRGIGLGLVREFLRAANTRVIATARRPEAAEELVAVLKEFKRSQVDKFNTGIYMYINPFSLCTSPPFT